MKIEMGESLIYSWLRHVKGCQIAQLNWKAGLIDPEKIKALQPLHDFLKSQFDLKTGLSQFIRQAEIDVLGIYTQENSYKIYAVDIAFHENGLNYGDNIERIAKKLIRSALVLIAYFNVHEGNIIFSTPLIKHSKEHYPEILKRIIDAFSSKGYNFTFEIIYNENFEKQILTPVIKKSKSIMDTSDLFIRVVKMLNLFGQQAEISSETSIEPEELIENVDEIQDVDRSDLPDITYEDIVNGNMKMGKKAQSFFTKLCQDGLLTKLMNTMPDLKLNRYALLKKNPKNDSELEDSKANMRYYSEPFTYDNDIFYLCNDWYPKNESVLVDIAKELKLI